MKSIRVFNESRNCYMKRNQALKAIENSACAWVEVGVSVRNLTYDEAAQARKSLVKDVDIHDPLPFAEWPGLIFRPADSGQATHRAELLLMQKTNEDYICECTHCTATREYEAQRAAAEAIRFVGIAV